MVSKLEQFQTFTGVDVVGLGRTGEDLFETSQLQVVDIEKPVVTCLEPRVSNGRA